jgi:hypothetical protein
MKRMEPTPGDSAQNEIPIRLSYAEPSVNKASPFTQA